MPSTTSTKKTPSARSASASKKRVSSASAQKSSSAKKSTSAKNTSRTSKSETYTLTGGQLVKKVQELIKEGNIRKITVLNKQGDTLLIIPVTAGVLITLFAPYLTVLGGLAALLTECSIKVERRK